MLTAGVDIGSRTAKAIILDDKSILYWKQIASGINSADTAWEVMNGLLAELSLPLQNISYIVGTGYGRYNVPFASKNVTEISCHARGAHWLLPGVRTILDMGGQDCKAIKCNAQGRVVRFLMNDKCAAGTGRYLERIAATLHVSLDEMGPRSLQIVQEPASIDSTCAVFAQRDVVTLLRQGWNVNDILAGACEAITRRMAAILQQVGIEEVVAITGGVANNIGIVSRLEKVLNVSIFVPPTPDIVGAIGAALFAHDRLLKVDNRATLTVKEESG